MGPIVNIYLAALNYAGGYLSLETARSYSNILQLNLLL